MDIERLAVCKIISTGRLQEAIGRGVRAEHFADKQCQKVFQFISDFSRQYGSTPSTSAVKREYPGWEFLQSEEPAEYIYDKFTEVVKRRLAQDLLLDLAESADDPERGGDIDLEFLEAARRLANLVPGGQVDYFKANMEVRIDEHIRERDEQNHVGIPFGFPTLDNWTGGIQRHELVTVSGFSGLGKSTLLMQICFNAWVAGFTPLYFSLEMESKAILRRLDTFATKFKYADFKNRSLSESQIDYWRKHRTKIMENNGEIPILDKVRSCTPETVFAETIRHAPDLVIIDYLSLMRSSRPTSKGAQMWQTLTEITQDLKQNARTLGVPIIVAAQTNRMGGREGAELDNIGYSFGVIQDSDIVLGLYADEDMRLRSEMEIRVNKNRDGRLGKFSARWNYEDMDFRELSYDDRFGRPGQQKEERQNGANRQSIPDAEQNVRSEGSRSRPNPRRRVRQPLDRDPSVEGREEEGRSN